MDNNKSVNWEVIMLGVVLLLAGVLISIKGMTAYQTAELIPPTLKSSWMSGPQAIAVGTLMVFVGIGLLLIEIKKLKR